MGWLAEQTTAFRARIEFGTLDLSGSLSTRVGDHGGRCHLVADPFHVTSSPTPSSTSAVPCAERDPRSSGPQVRSSLSLPAPFDQGQGAGSTTRATKSSPASFVPAIPIGDVATLWQAKEALASSMHTPIRPRPRVGHPAGQRPEGQGLRDRGPLARTHPAPLETPDCRRGPGPRLPRTHRSGQQLHRAGQARRARVHVVLELTDLLPRWPRSRRSPEDAANAAELGFRDPRAPKFQEATGFSQRLVRRCICRNLVVTSVLASGHGLGG